MCEACIDAPDLTGAVEILKHTAMTFDPADDLVRIAACRHGEIRYFSTDDTIGQALELYGEWAEADVHLMSQIVRPGDIVIEAGANIGTHTLALAQIVGERGCVHAFEPSPWAYSLLAANLASNGVTSVQTYQACVGAASGKLGFPMVSPRQITNLGAVGFHTIESLPEAEMRDCPLVSIDSLALSRIDLIKIDVEGYELEVLEGAMASIAALRPTIFIETQNAVAARLGWGGFAPAIIDRLRPLGYSFWHYPTPMFNRNNWRGHADNVFENMWSFDMLCVPRERFVVVGLVDAEIGSMRDSTYDEWESAAVVRIG